MFSFLAKQGQEEQIACLLSGRFNRPVHIKPYNGKRGQGKMITMELKDDSKRTIDRFLHSCHVPGSVSRRNKYKVMKGDSFSVRWRAEYGKPFYWVENGRFQGLYERVYVNSGCDCCGGWDELVKLN